MHIKRDILLKLADPEFQRLKPDIAAKYADFTIPVRYFPASNCDFLLFTINLIILSVLARRSRMGRPDFG